MKNCFSFVIKIILSCSISMNCFAGIITIDHDVQDIWWWNGVAQKNGTELRTNDVSYSNQRVGVQFNDLRQLSGIEILSAEIQLFRYSGYWGSKADMTIDAYTINSLWDESSNIPSYDSYAITTTTYTDSDAYGWKSWEITELTKAWMMEEVVNNGVMLAGLGENKFQRFYSSEYAGFGPRLIINTVEVPEPSTLLMFLCSGVMLLNLKRFPLNNLLNLVK
jgi:hypothetical protein